MKKTLFFLVLFSVQIVTAQIQVAILEPVGVTPEVTLMHRSMVRGEMVKAIGRQNGYVAFNRADIDQIMKEQNFQQSGMVDDATRKRLGAMQGVDCVCITKITKEGNIYYLEANLVNIESGQISNPATQYGELQGGSLANMLTACEKLAAELVGNTVASPHTATTSSHIHNHSSSTSTSSQQSANQNEEKISVSYKTLRVDNKTIVGHHNIIEGNNNRIFGNNNSIRGDNNTIQGNDNKAYGENNKTYGFNNK